MAIQNRRGSYTNFDPDKMVAGEFAVVRDGDPNSSTGRSVYLCFEPGVVKRLADYEDIRDMVADVAEEYIQDFDDAVSALTDLIPDTEQAKDDANAAAEAANEAAEAASAVVQAGNDALGHAFTTCSNASTIATKNLTIDGFQFVKGGMLSIRFDYGSAVCTALNINNTTKSVYYHGVAGVPAGIIGKNDTATFIYNGSIFMLISVNHVRPTWINFGTVSSLPVTKTYDSPTYRYVNGDMKCVKAVLGTPSAQASDWTVTTTDAGEVTIDGSISGSTTVELLLEPVVDVS